MELAGSQTISARREAVWAALNDPAVLRACIPGCQSLEPSGENAFNAIVEVKVGPIGAAFRSTVRLEDLDPPSSYRIVGEGRGGMAGNAVGSAFVSLQAHGDDTLLEYTVTAEIGGRLAQLGSAVVEATARRLADQFFTRLNRVLTTGGIEQAGALAAQSDEQPAPGGGPVGPRRFPWGFIVAALAIAVAAWLVGGQAVTVPGRTLIAAAMLLVFATAFGFEVGRRR